MSALWLPALLFLLGLTLGCALTWLGTLFPARRTPSHATTTEGWTVSAITARLEAERTHLPLGRVA
ncbi:hypothetical protein [Nocardia huaxiensis]|uniref:Uncharacterized protein n=1 Tax=Nocardia huaxiensis TaxID=2755382 RepID=A0A7D6ZGI4_9NOCA|nr:hypothetical protein [Nocardia huaxiensis]QLY29300.1 hypothetical protein H0264_29075 [Nocardia huaxiensis]UFS97224.1 hypothetical protein LPY97_04665 [Nocardia huaxiensis]